ncbi:MAG: prepilin-type N-terminal cleavage/methylation domain-containing protein [Clostridia bacterium]|nr:prepilin-type N-terminal cleavage/methylation domain-containing protein [Clostridia bacterium]
MLKHLSTKKGFTLIELLIVLAIIGILMSIAIPTYLDYAKKTTIAVLDSNEEILLRTINLMKVSGELPIAYQTLARILADSGMYIKNPLDGNQGIRYSNEIGWSTTTGAAIVISQRASASNPGMNTQANNPTTHLYPLNASASSQNKLNGALCIQACKDGYLFYYYYGGTAHNIRQFPY